MIAFYDLLLLDDTHCISEAYEDRRTRLQTLIRPKPGRAEVGRQVTVDFRRSQAASLDFAALPIHTIGKAWS